MPETKGIKKSMSSFEQTSFNSIKSLIDDETPLVREAVIQQLKNFPDQGKIFLKDILEGGGPTASEARPGNQ